MMITELTEAQVKDTVLRLFEDARKRPGAPAEPERFLAFLTDPPAPSGRRVRDTFAGRFRFVGFMQNVQLEFGICFTNAEWDKGLSLDDFAQLVLAKASKPEQAKRLAEQRLGAARMRRRSDPLKFGLLASPLLIGLMLSSNWRLVALVSVPWALVVGGIAAFVLKDLRYAEKLVARTTK